VLAYGFNTVSIDPETTPIGVSVDAVKRNFSPGWRSGELIEFPVRRERNAVVKVLLASGEPVPAGAAVTVEGVEGATVTGHGGRVFVVGLPDAGARMSIALPGGPCVVSVEGGAGAADAVPVLGPYTCGAQAR
jgi:outer membrane usher protein